MDKDEISQERQEKFWEWCGFQKRGYWIYSPQMRVVTSENHVFPITLNNLFKYAWDLAVKKLMEKWQRDNAIDILFANWRHEWGLHTKDPATALFLAIEKVINEG